MTTLGVVMYGNKVAPAPGRSVIGAVETSAAGNIVIRVGVSHITGTWHQTEHVVLTRSEAREFVLALVTEIAGDA